MSNQRDPNIDLKLIKTFVSIYECRSMSRAAESHFCSPAAVSMRLKLIEEEIRAPLFIRHHNRLDPTDLGERLYWKAISLLDTYDDLIETARERSAVRTIRVGVPDDYALSFVQRSLRNIDLTGENIEIDIICDLSTHLDVAIQRQEIDIGLATLDYLPSTGSLISRLNLNWVGHAEFLPNLTSVVPIAVYPEGCVFRRAMIEALEARQRAWRIASQSRTSSGVLAAVRAGLAITTMADGSVPDDLTIVEHPVLPRLKEIPVYLLKGAGRNAGLKFIEEAILDQFSQSDTS